jgi:hypothetical protein
VQEFRVISSALNRVANCVTKIQNRAFACPVALIYRDNP